MGKPEQRAASWAVSDEFWKRVEPLLPEKPRDPDRHYVRKPGGGRKPKDSRLVFEAILYVLRTGRQWRSLPHDPFGSASAIHKRFLEWEEAGLFEALWRAGLAEHDEMEGIVWRWQRMDGEEIKTPLVQGPVGPGSPDRVKGRRKASAGSGRAWRPVANHRSRRASP